MPTTLPSDSARAVDMWIRYVEKFGATRVTVQRLINRGFDYAAITAIFKEAIAAGQPLDAEALLDSERV